MEDQSYTAGPAGPDITFGMMLRQVKADLYDKEVQSAATYSYLWIADQMGHFGLGLLLELFVGALAGLFLAADSANQVGFGITAVGVSLWEASAYRDAVAKAGTRFVLDKGMLAR